MIAPGASCPCGGGAYEECCGPYLAGGAAPTAVALMRSRFTAFAVNDAAYLEATWHPSTRPDRVDLDASLRWRRLTVVRVEEGQPGDRRGIVEFRAGWTDGGADGILEERSRFVFQRDRWWYVDGDVT